MILLQSGVSALVVRPTYLSVYRFCLVWIDPERVAYRVGVAENALEPIHLVVHDRPIPSGTEPRRMHLVANPFLLACSMELARFDCQR